MCKESVAIRNTKSGLSGLTRAANQAIDFAREQADEDLWEDLLRYSESKPGKFSCARLMRSRNSLDEECVFQPSCEAC